MCCQRLPVFLLLERVYSRASILAIEERVIGGNSKIAFELMKRAASAAYRVMLNEFPDATRIQVLCGSGNNAGDGYVLAALAQADAKATGKQVEVLRIGKVPAFGQTAWEAYQMAEQAGVSIMEAKETNGLVIEADLVVDALLGTGVMGALRPNFAEAIQSINASPAKILSLDLPSGMNADTGSAEGVIVQADATISFIGAKRGMVTGGGKAATGTLIIDRLGLTDADYDGYAGHQQLRWEDVKSRLPRLETDAHKHQFGHLLVIGGDFGMGGAAIMAAQSALRVGTGLVSLMTRPEHIAPALAVCPEVMAMGVSEDPERILETQQPNAIVIGPGLGDGDWGQRLLQAVAELDVPILADGSALTLMGEHLGAARTNKPNGLAVITPHPGEAARLLGCSAVDVNEDRFTAASELSQKMDAVTLLKGAGSLIADAGSDDSAISVCAQGNPGMATAGSGDVLAGIIGGLLAQGRSAMDATLCGTCLHAAAGDIAAHDLGQRSLNATDILARLPELLRDLD